jgi:hypothetical protein
MVRLWRALGELLLTSWVKRVNVKREIDWLGSTNASFDLLDDTIHSNGIDLSRLYDLKSTISVVLIVTGTTQCGANACVDVGVIGEQTFLGSMVEVCAVVDASNFAW